MLCIVACNLNVCRNQRFSEACRQTIEKLEEKQRVEAAAGHHDDLFMAAAIALWSAHDMEFNDLGNIEETAKKRERRTTEIIETYQPVTQLPIAQRKDFINTACSYDDVHNYDFPERY